MSLDMPLDLVEAAAKNLNTAQEDLKSLIQQTSNRATDDVNSAIGGDINTAMVDLIALWKREVTDAASILADFEHSMRTSGNQMSENVAAESKKISGIDVHAQRLG